MAFTQVTVTGTYRDAEGDEAVGAVVFTPAAAMRNDSIVVASPVTAQIVDGAISVSLAATDDPDTLPLGVTYEVVEQIVGTRYRRRYQLPVPYAGGAIDLDDPDTVIVESDPVITVPVSGPPGLSVVGAEIDGDGHLIITLSNATELDAGAVANATIINTDDNPGRTVYVGDTEPASPATGDVWIKPQT